MIEERIERITRGWEMKGWEKGREEGRTQGRAEGREEGREEGRTEGRYEEARRLFLELFEAKFEEPAPKEIRTRIKSATRKDLETWSKRLLKAKTPADIFG